MTTILGNQGVVHICDRGVRTVVAALRGVGLETTDSGDGSKFGNVEGALPYAHVFIRVTGDPVVEMGLARMVIPEDWVVTEVEGDGPTTLLVRPELDSEYRYLVVNYGNNDYSESVRRVLQGSLDQFNDDRADLLKNFVHPIEGGVFQKRFLTAVVKDASALRALRCMRSFHGDLYGDLMEDGDREKTLHAHLESRLKVKMADDVSDIPSWCNGEVAVVDFVDRLVYIY